MSQTKLVTIVLDMSTSPIASQHINLGFIPSSFDVIAPETTATSEYVNVISSSLAEQLCVLKSSSSSVTQPTFSHIVPTGTFKDNTKHVFQLDVTTSGQLITGTVVLPIMFRS